MRYVILRYTLKPYVKYVFEIAQMCVFNIIMCAFVTLQLNCYTVLNTCNSTFSIIYAYTCMYRTYLKSGENRSFDDPSTIYFTTLENTGT